jgi:hypothetical protein
MSEQGHETMRQLVQKLPEQLQAEADKDAKYAEQRRAPRDEVALPTRMFSQDNRGGDVLLVNISPFGFMAREYGETPKGTMVRLVLPRLGQVTAKVVWSLGGRVGAEFLKPIDSYAYTAMLNAAKAKRQRWPMG